MNKAEILVIDDEPQIRKLLEITLESSGYTAHMAQTGQEGLTLAANHPPDLIILDLGLPDQSGHQVLRQLRTWYAKAILILSVENNEQDIVSALDNGATDYITKPFRSAELLARIRAALRHHPDPNGPTVISSDDLTIDISGRIVMRNRAPVKLTVTEFNLLALLARYQGRVLTHRFILKEIWGTSFQQETQYLRVFVGTLRKKIEDDPSRPRHILTESGVGYRFT
jgi:two-component system KDP operon response regulator KdpE